LELFQSFRSAQSFLLQVYLALHAFLGQALTAVLTEVEKALVVLA
jgi:hypothetical protein